jgi:hypothetical protein
MLYGKQAFLARPATNPPPGKTTPLKRPILADEVVLRRFYLIPDI